MRKIIFLLISSVLMIVAINVHATRCTETDVAISKLRAVGDYTSGDQHDDTLELHHNSRNWCGLTECSSNHRVIIDKERSHLVAAAYMAFASGKLVDITIDTVWPTRSGICVVSILDVKN
jgi:hypothetical protein